MKSKANTKPEPIPCFECDSGTMHPIRQDYTTSHPKLGALTIPKVAMLRCNQCGDLLIGHEGNTQIDAYFAEALNSITPAEVQQFLDKYNLSQKQASIITGLGEKNISRWLNGHSRASESISNYLRLLSADAQTFERLKQKNFVGCENASYPAEDRQPDKEEKEVLTEIDFAVMAKYGILEKTQSPKERRTLICAEFKQSNIVDFAEFLKTKSTSIAAFKDTDQKCSEISSGLWIHLGERAASKIATAPYDRDKLKAAVPFLRELSQHPLEDVFTEIRDILAKAGVALVITPILEKSALRGCARLLTSRKAIINLSIKYRNYSTFWITLFHEIAHLLLHINSPDDVIPEYENQKEDEREIAANQWAYDTLLSQNHALEFLATTLPTEIWKLKEFAQKRKIHPAIAAEICNKYTGKEYFNYGRLRMEKLFPTLSDVAFRAWIQ
jgi:HTH-type transcriptional regulator/antitoxin HigA